MAEAVGNGTHTRLDNVTSRLRRCVALLTASRRRAEVVEAVGDAGSEEEATQAVSELLEVDPESAGAIVDMPVKAFAQDRVSALEDEVGRLQEKVATLGEGSRRPDSAG